MAELSLSTVLYNTISWNNRQRVYAAEIGSVQTGSLANTLERAYTPAVGTRPIRSLTKFSLQAPNAAGELYYPCSLHMVATIDPRADFADVQTYFNNTTNGLYAQLRALVEIGTDNLYLNEILNGAI